MSKNTYGPLAKEPTEPIVCNEKQAAEASVVTKAKRIKWKRATWLCFKNRTPRNPTKQTITNRTASGLIRRIPRRVIRFAYSHQSFPALLPVDPRPCPVPWTDITPILAAVTIPDREYEKITPIRAQKAKIWDWDGPDVPEIYQLNKRRERRRRPRCSDADLIAPTRMDLYHSAQFQTEDDRLEVILHGGTHEYDLVSPDGDGDEDEIVEDAPEDDVDVDTSDTVDTVDYPDVDEVPVPLRTKPAPVAVLSIPASDVYVKKFVTLPLPRLAEGEAPESWEDLAD